MKPHAQRQIGTGCISSIQQWLTRVAGTWRLTCGNIVQERTGVHGILGQEAFQLLWLAKQLQAGPCVKCCSEMSLVIHCCV